MKRLLNHAYEGGVTGGYIRREFNPGKERKSFQRVCDYILDRRVEYLGEKSQEMEGFNEKEALGELKCYALELGLDFAKALEKLA